jgi:hypothetical protein
MANSANSADDLADKFQDYKKRVKFVQGGSRQQPQATQNKNNNNSSSSGSDDEANDEFDNANATFVNQSINNLMPSGGGGATSTSAGNSSSGGIGSSRKSKKRAVWELLEGYRDKNAKINKPTNFEGILLKRRNWPMKGWHKRYFILIDGTLSYGKSKSDVNLFCYTL